VVSVGALSPYHGELMRPLAEEARQAPFLAELQAEVLPKLIALAGLTLEPPASLTMQISPVATTTVGTCAYRVNWVAALSAASG